MKTGSDVPEGSDDEGMGMDSPTDKVGDETDVSTAQDEGIMKKIIKAGTGWQTPEDGADVQVHYVGTLLDGTQFDSSRDRGEPFSFKIGQGSVIKGWDQGVAKMKKGEIAQLTCKPEYAYGEAGKPPTIPPSSTLQFEVELISWTSDKDIAKTTHGVDKAQDLLKRTVVEGANTWDHPRYGSKVVFSAKCTAGNGPSFEDKEHRIGDAGLPKVIERAVKNLSKGEKAIITAKASSRYVQGDTDCVWECELKEYEKTKDSWSLSASEKIESALAMKEEGNAAFKAGDHKMAAKKYKHAIKFVESDYNASDAEKKELGACLATVAGNAAAVAVVKKDWKAVIDHCDKALGKDHANTKALMRRGKAHNELNNR
eukprot:161029_1